MSAAQHLERLWGRVSKAWDEESHPRDDKGRFGSGGGSISSGKPAAVGRTTSGKEMPARYAKSTQKAIAEAHADWSAKDHVEAAQAHHKAGNDKLAHAHASISLKKSKAAKASAKGQPAKPKTAAPKRTPPPPEKQLAAVQQAQEKQAAAIASTATHVETDVGPRTVATPVMPPPKAAPAPKKVKPAAPEVAKAPLKAAEDKALKSYQGSGFTRMQNKLRQGKQTNETKALDAAIAKQSLGNDAVVYRGIGGEWAAKYIAIAKPGAVIKEKGFVSTSANKSIAHTFASMNADDDDGSKVVFHMNVRKGAKVLDVRQHIQGNSTAQKEAEYLFGSGTRYRVSKVERSRGVHHIHVEVL